MAIHLLVDVTKQQEMAVEFRGLQPVVAKKQINSCGVKGHSQRSLVNGAHDFFSVLHLL